MMSPLAHHESAATGEVTTHTAPGRALLDLLENASSSAAVTLASGRRYDIAAAPEGDRLVVRARDGQVVLRITITDAGPVLAFEAAEIELRSARSMRLDAEMVEISTRALRTHVTGDVETRITGARHTHIDGADHLEADSVQVQANEGAVELRAAGRIALDGEHIGLNDDPCPRPFAWSAVAGGPEAAGATEKEGA